MSAPWIPSKPLSTLERVFVPFWAARERLGLTLATHKGEPNSVAEPLT